MTLEALRCLKAVIDEGSFRGAAERLHRTQSAVSQQIKGLENGCGRTLVDRRNGRPTPAGRLVYERACRILAETEDLSRELHDFNESAASELRLGTSDTTALYVLPKLVRDFARAFPDTRLVIVNRSSDAIAEMVARGDLDLGIVTLPLGHANLAEQALFAERLVLVTPKSHPLAGRGNVALSDLRNVPLLQLEPETRTGRVLREHFVKKHFEPRIVLRSGSFEVIKRYVQEGIGVAILPELTVTVADKNLAVVHVAELPRVHIGAVWRAQAYRGRAQRAFLEILASNWTA